MFEQVSAVQTENKINITARIVLKNKTIAVAFNDYGKSHTFQKRYAADEHKIYWHAETRAIFNALKYINRDDLKKATLYVVRSKTLKIGEKLKITTCGMAAPCQGCREAIKEFGIKKVVYSCDPLGNSVENLFKIEKRG